MKTSKKIIIIIIGLVVFGFVVVALAGMFKFNFLANQPGYDVDGNRIEDVELVENDVSSEEEGVGLPVAVTDYRDLEVSDATATEVVSGLDAPWGFAWLPNGDMLVTERFGELKLVQNGQLEAIAGVPEVFASGQGGLLDVTVHPDFENNQLVYLSYAHGSQEGNRLRVVRAELIDLSLQNLEVIFEVGETKTGNQHFGSRFAWLPDDTLLFSVGDGGNPPTEYNGELIRTQAQNLNAHLGKIIRISDDGSVPDDNPFIGRPDVNPEIYSYGHRNVQGITFDTLSERVFASEHGSLGGDELNLILPGENYGWPLATYSTEYNALGTEISESETLAGTQNPIAVWTPTIAPSAVVVYNGGVYGEDVQGKVFVSAMLLRSNTNITAYATRPAGAIMQLSIDESGAVTEQSQINVGDVRVRSLGQGPDGYLYVLTDTTDRQSRPGENAGKIVRVEAL